MAQTDILLVTVCRSTCRKSVTRVYKESDIFIVRHWDMGQCRTIKTMCSHYKEEAVIADRALPTYLLARTQTYQLSYMHLCSTGATVSLHVCISLFSHICCYLSGYFKHVYIYTYAHMYTHCIHKQMRSYADLVEACFRVSGQPLDGWPCCCQVFT